MEPSPQPESLPESAPDPASRATPMQRGRGPLVLLAVLVVACLAVILRSAWIAEDAFITLRTSDNLLHGLGLTWNPGERVQAYTHPLWMFLLTLAYWLAGEPYFGALGLSLAVSSAFLVLFAVLHRAAPLSTILGLLGLVTSKAFVDYSTSGLENPLTNLLLLLAYATFWDKATTPASLRRVAFLAALGACNRPDAILFYVPILAVMGWRMWTSGQRAPALRAVAVGFLPLVAWLGFAFFYYGNIAPNTAYAKLNAGLAFMKVTERGGYYLAVSSYVDPMSTLLLLAGLLICLLPRWRRFLPAGAAILLGALYVIRIGGDFMAGRMIVAPIVLSCMVIARMPLRSTRKAWLVGALIVILGSLPARSPLRSGSGYGTGATEKFGFRGIGDARAKTYPTTGLYREERRETVDHHWAKKGRELRKALRTAPPAECVRVTGAIGFFGFYSGPRAILIDHLALTDPLLARLPIADPRTWRPGHVKRDIPAGYLETRRTGVNQIEDPALAEFYGHVALVVSGELWSAARLLTALKLQTGAYDHLVDSYLERTQ